jgi:uncharacterized protein YcbK (DUF882 family)
MKTNLKKIMAAIAATVMCAVPMTSAMTASAAPHKVSRELVLTEEQESVIESAIVKQSTKVKSKAQLRKLMELFQKREKVVVNPIASDKVVEFVVVGKEASSRMGDKGLLIEPGTKDWGPLTPYIDGRDVIVRFK